MLILFLGSVNAQAQCIKNKPTNPYPRGIDTLCQSDPAPDLSKAISADSISFSLEWTVTDSTLAPTNKPPTIITTVSGTTVVYVRQYKKSQITCHSSWQSLTFTVLSKPPIKPAIIPMPPAPANRKISICEGSMANLTDSLVSQAGYTVHWYALDSLGNKVVFNGIIPKAKYTGRDTLFYAQEGASGYCFGDTLQVHVAVLPLPVLKVNPIKGYTICEGQDIPFNVLDAHTGYKPTYDWYVNDQQVNARSGNTYTISGGTFKAGDPVKVYYVVHIDKFAPYYHCDSVGTPTLGYSFRSDTISIKILPKSKVPGPIAGPYIVYAGQKNLFYSVPLDTTLAYQWRIDNPGHASVNYANNTASISYSDTLNFSTNKQIIDTITVVVQNVCDSAKETLVVYIRPYLKPINILTPNGDNINDTWIINNIDNEAYIGNHVRIYDRFGTLVYDQQNYSNASAWNGTYKGNALSEGTYYFILEYHEDTFTKALKGYITILRNR